MPVSVRIEVDEGALARLLRLPTGAVARDMLRRGERVRAEARRLVGKRTGRLAASITVELVGWRGAHGARVGSNLEYARFVHDGTGRIVARRGRALRFDPGGGVIYRRSTRGQPAQRYLTRALDAAR